MRKFLSLFSAFTVLITLLLISGVSAATGTIVAFDYTSSTASASKLAYDATSGANASGSALSFYRQGASGSYANIGAGGKTSVNCPHAGLAWTVGDGWEIKFSAAGYENLKFSAKQKATASGPAQFNLEYKIGAAGSYSQIPSSDVIAVGVGDDTDAALQTTYNEFSLPSALNDKSEVYIKVTLRNKLTAGGSILNDGNGNTAINNIKIEGDTLNGGNNPVPSGEAAKLVVGAVYFSTDNASSMTNSFIEIYNPNDAAVLLTGKYSLQYKSMNLALTPNWQKLNLTGTIPARHSFLVDCGPSWAVSNYDLPVFDQVFSGISVHNKGVKVVIMSNQSEIPQTLRNPFDGDGAGQITGYLDMFGVSGNDDKFPTVDGFETECIPAADSNGQSKQKGFVRISADGERYKDTDNNAEDFQIQDYRSTGMLIPRALEDGEYTPPEPEYRDIISINNPNKISVPLGTLKESLLFPETVTVGLDDGGEVSANVSWTSAAYNPNAAGAYNFTGVLTPQSPYITNTFELTATLQVEVLPGSVPAVKAYIRPASQTAAYDANGVITYNIAAKDYSNLKILMVDFSYDPTKLILQNSAGDTGVYSVEQVSSGRARIIYTLPDRVTSGIETNLYSLKFKPTAAVKGKSATVTLNAFWAGIDEGLGVEEAAAVTVGTATVQVVEFSFDINRDGVINLGDLVYAEYFSGSTVGGVNWTTAQSADDNGDNKVGNDDIVIIAGYIANNY
jgi:hypothetical protein